MKSGQVGAKYIAKQRVKKREVTILSHVKTVKRSTYVNVECRTRKGYYV